MISYNIYYKEVKAITEQLVLYALEQCDNDSDQALELIKESLLHEWIDSHEWIIYNAYHLPVLQHSSNSEYMLDELGEDEAASVLKEKGLSGLHCALAYWAMYADVMDILSDTIDDICEQLDGNE